MEGTEKLHMDKYKEITNDWNYDASYTHTSLPVKEIRKFQALDFCCTVYLDQKSSTIMTRLLQLKPIL
jgi:hypothetical protein